MATVDEYAAVIVTVAVASVACREARRDVLDQSRPASGCRRYGRRARGASGVEVHNTAQERVGALQPNCMTEVDRVLDPRL